MHLTDKETENDRFCVIYTASGKAHSVQMSEGQIDEVWARMLDQSFVHFTMEDGSALSLRVQAIESISEGVPGERLNHAPRVALIE